MPDVHLLGLAAGSLAACLLALWLVSLAVKDSSIVDLFWGLGFVLVAWLGVAFGPGVEGRRWLVAAVTTLWGVRLAGYLAWRNLGRGEDPRYARLRMRHRPWWLKSLVIVFLLQGALMLLVSLPLQVAASLAAPPLGAVDVLAALVVLGGVAFEATGDWQLARFKADPANRGLVMASGLWRFTRHPNYFGDLVVWCGLFLFAAATGVGAWTAISPLLMGWLLRRVSGVPMLEAAMKHRPGYEAYVRRTSAFLPRRPREP
jgi:steroid 5-alpha reductase family enzyme